MNEVVIIRAFITVYANSQHWRGAYKLLPADTARAAADEVATTVLGLERGTLLALADEIERSPYNVNQRIEWIEETTETLVNQVQPLVAS